LIKKVSHIGIAVKNISEALKIYRDQLNLKFEGEEEVPSQGVKIAFLRVNETRIELLEPLSENSPVARFLAKRGEGVHHIALETDNIEEDFQRLKGKGLVFVDEKPRTSERGVKIAFLHPKSTKGVLLELCQEEA
jgi:methylmalonyl-CoA/ethylmalonyl-CoA epimerase